jgi:uncharacterized protein YwlG (UPF0340 family)
MGQHNKKQVKKEFVVLLGLSLSKQLGYLLGKSSQFGLGQMDNLAAYYGQIVL